MYESTRKHLTALRCSSQTQQMDFRCPWSCIFWNCNGNQKSVSFSCENCSWRCRSTRAPPLHKSSTVTQLVLTSGSSMNSLVTVENWSVIALPTRILWACGSRTFEPDIKLWSLGRLIQGPFLATARCGRLEIVPGVVEETEIKI